MLALRTPDERFEGLVGFPFAPHYVDIDCGDGTGESLRLHYVDVGPADAAETVLLLHGEPSWSYLYRKMIPGLLDAGYRVIAPDLIGFGRSDKPANRTDYTYARHVEWLRAALFDRINVDDLTLFCQDWGGLIGLRLVGEHPERFRRVIAANTGMPTGDLPASEAFLNWQRFSQEIAEMPIGFLVNGATVSDLTPEVIAGYDAPFPDETYKEGARQFPLLVPTSPEDPASVANRLAWKSLGSFTKPFLCAFSDGDPITRGADKQFLSEVPGAAGMPHTTIRDGGHFLQEDKGEELAGVVVAFIGATPA